MIRTADPAGVDPEEMLVAYQMNWKGENIYTGGERIRQAAVMLAEVVGGVLLDADGFPIGE